MQNVNSVVITGNLTRDPDLRYTDGGTAVCNLRVAVNGRRKNGDGEYEDKPNFFNVSVWGAHGKACADCLKKGRPVAVEGRLDWRERETDDGRREYVSIVANMVQFLGGKPQEEEDGTDATASEDSEDRQPEPAAASGEDDIPF
jgi:single-strand DNA-binding protein